MVNGIIRDGWFWVRRSNNAGAPAGILGPAGEPHGHTGPRGVLYLRRQSSAVLQGKINRFSRVAQRRDMYMCARGYYIYVYTPHCFRRLNARAGIKRKVGASADARGKKRMGNFFFLSG